MCTYTLVLYKKKQYTMQKCKEYTQKYKELQFIFTLIVDVMIIFQNGLKVTGFHNWKNKLSAICGTTETHS